MAAISVKASRIEGVNLPSQSASRAASNTARGDTIIARIDLRARTLSPNRSSRSASQPDARLMSSSACLAGSGGAVMAGLLT